MMNFLGALVDFSCISRELTGRLPMFSFHSCFHVFPQVTPVKFEQNPSPQVWSVNLCTPDPSTWHGGNPRGPPSQCHPKSNNKIPGLSFFGRDYDVAKPTIIISDFFSGQQKNFWCRKKKILWGWRKGGSPGEARKNFPFKEKKLPQ